MLNFLDGSNANFPELWESSTSFPRNIEKNPKPAHRLKEAIFNPTQTRKNNEKNWFPLFPRPAP
ncbi:MAG: hypothetical protein MUO62_00505, partial [Anaerolineales bacterium]|nr:hypothetical protein [Anaerolineales bacterium]